MSGKWITFVQAEHTCPPPNITIESGSAGIGSVWQCECGQRWIRAKNDWEKMTGWGRDAMIDWNNFQPAPWHKDECKQFIMTWAHPEEALCICEEVSAAYQRGREDAAEAVERVSSLLQPLGPALAAIDALMVGRSGNPDTPPSAEEGEQA